MARTLRGERYVKQLAERDKWLPAFITNELPYLDYYETCPWYKKNAGNIGLAGQALLGCNDRYYLLTGPLNRYDLLHPWLFDRCREVERDPDGHIDLWARFHAKSSIITCGGIIQEIMCDPEITIAIFSVVKPIALEFLAQIKNEFETNDLLKAIYSDVLYSNPRARIEGEGKPSKWGTARGITVKRRERPKEATIEAHGLIDGQPTGRHFKMHVYDDVVTQDHLSEDQLKKTTLRFQMADNLGTRQGVRKWICGTRYHFADAYGQIIEAGSAIPRIYPATFDGTLANTRIVNGKTVSNLVLLTIPEWERIKRDQSKVVAAQMLLDPRSGNEATFQITWARTYEVIPAVMNVYILVDPSKGKGARSDRTAIAVIGIDQGGVKYLLDGARHRMKLSERWHYIKALKLKWETHPGVQMVKVGYEQYGLVDDLSVLEDFMRAENNTFKIEELNTPETGGHSKVDRIDRLEPDIRDGRFQFPIIVHHRDMGGLNYWSVWTEEHAKIAREKELKNDYHVGQIIYRKALKPTKRMTEVKPSRAVQAIRRRDENGEIYDLTRDFLDEMRDHPFALHDDLLDAAARIYDIDPQSPVAYERNSTESLDVEAASGAEVE